MSITIPTIFFHSSNWKQIFSLSKFPSSECKTFPFSRFVIEYILEKFIKLSATRVENRIILKLHTYCSIHRGSENWADFQHLPVLIFIHTLMWCDVYIQWFTYTRAQLQPLATTNNKLGGVFHTNSLLY